MDGLSAPPPAVSLHAVPVPVTPPAAAAGHDSAQVPPAATVVVPRPAHAGEAAPPLPAAVQRAKLDAPPPAKLMTREQMAALLSLTT